MSNTATDVLCNDYSMPKENALQYVTGYIIYKCTKKFQCNVCIRNWTCALSDKNCELFVQLKRYDQDCKLVNASQQFVNFFRKVEDQFVANFEAVCHNEKVINRLVLLIQKNIEFNDIVCGLECIELILYAVRLFVKVRLCHVLKLQNDSFSQVKSKRNGKMLKLCHL